MAAGAVRDACRAALAERETSGAAEVDVERVYRHAPTFPLDPENGQVMGERAHVSLATCAMRVVAEVDVELGLTRLVWIGAAQDVGKALNPQSITGQIEGGTAQGIGLALMEEIQTRDGRITNASFTDYLLPTALDMPPVESVLIEDPGAGRPLRPQGRRRAADRRLDRRRGRGAARRDREAAAPRAGAAGRDLPLALALTSRRAAGSSRPGRRGTSRRITTATEVEDHRRTGRDLPRHDLVEEEDAERDRDERIDVGVGRDGAERDVVRPARRTRCSRRSSRTRSGRGARASDRVDQSAGLSDSPSARARPIGSSSRPPASPWIAGDRERVARHRQPRREERPDRPRERRGDDEQHAGDGGASSGPQEHRDADEPDGGSDERGARRPVAGRRAKHDEPERDRGEDQRCEADRDMALGREQQRVGADQQHPAEHRRPEPSSSRSGTASCHGGSAARRRAGRRPA